MRLEAFRVPRIPVGRRSAAQARYRVEESPSGDRTRSQLQRQRLPAVLHGSIARFKGWLRFSGILMPVLRPVLLFERMSNCLQLAWSEYD